MRFFCSEFWDHKGNPRPWADLDLDEYKTIHKYFNRYIKVWDSDDAGDVKIYFVFENGKAFCLEYSWWISYDSEWHIDEEMTVDEIKLEHAQHCMTTFRDIIAIPQHSDLPIAKPNT